MTEPEKPEGVWIVADTFPDSDYIAVFPTELDALRFVNSPENFANYRARHLPYGTWLHDLNYPPKDRAS
jgi:hypothetical protein